MFFKKNYFNNFILCIYTLLMRSLESLQSTTSQIRARTKQTARRQLVPPPLTSLRVLPGRRRVPSLRVPGVDHLGAVFGHQLDQTWGKSPLSERAPVLRSLLKRQSGRAQRETPRSPRSSEGFVRGWQQRPPRAAF